MKKEGIILGLLVISILIISSISFVSAQDEEPQPNMPRAGITPDSIFYGFDVFFDNLRVALTFRAVNKAKLRLKIMEERMAEMGEMAENNKIIEAEKAQSQVQTQMQKFQGSVEKVKKKDAEELNEHIQAHSDTLEILKQRLGDSDWAEAINDAMILAEELENAIVSIPEDLGPDSIFMISALCEEAGATTAAECQEMVAGGLLIIQYHVAPEIEGWNTTDQDPHNCSEFWANNETKWCCYNSFGNMYSPNIEHLYRKGTVEYKIINLETEEIEGGIETDSCDGDTLTEWFCPRVLDMNTRNERYSEEYECPHSCEDGACIIDIVSPEEEFKWVECSDSDGGKDYFVKGTMAYTYNVTRETIMDTCIDDSLLAEGVCGDNNEVGIDIHTCPNGCEDGVCISG